MTGCCHPHGGYQGRKQSDLLIECGLLASSGITAVPHNLITAIQRPFLPQVSSSGSPLYTVELVVIEIDFTAREVSLRHQTSMAMASRLLLIFMANIDSVFQQRKGDQYAL